MPLLHGTDVNLSYVIASLQRTGSYMLCEGLINTGIAGKPTEGLGSETIPLMVKEWGVADGTPFNEYIGKMVKACTSRNGVFGVKVHFGQMEWTRKKLGIGEPYDCKTLDYLFPDAKYIYIWRKDVRGQAISSYRAYHTEEWWRKKDVHNSQIKRPDPIYSAEHIRAWERLFPIMQEKWRAYFDERKITPLVVEYEDLVQDWRREVRRCLTYLGLDPTAVDDAPEITMIRQADAVTRAWRRRLDEEDRQSGVIK